MEGKRFSDLPSISYGDKVRVAALNFETDEFKIYDYVMDENGNIIFDDGEEMDDVNDGNKNEEEE